MHEATCLGSSFGVTREGVGVDLWTLTNSDGFVAKIIGYGAALTEFWVLDRRGQLGDVVCGFDNLRQYETESPCFGATVGRLANRLRRGCFELDGVAYHVPLSDGENSIHGGLRGYDKRVWSGIAVDLPDAVGVRFSLMDRDGEEGFPGDVDVQVTYTLSNSNVLRLEYEAQASRATPINLTNHSYWNLRDGGGASVFDHRLQIYADLYTVIDDLLIPTGEIVSVAGTPLDFRVPRPIGMELGRLRGFDHNFVIRGTPGELRRAAVVYDAVSGREMEVWTTKPGMQFYSANYLSPALIGKEGVRYGYHHALCLETQGYPDSPNHPHFPSVILRPGEVYRHVTEHRFGLA